MANNKERKPEEEEEEEERKIPVFTVQKNGAILKNIFVVNKPPPSPPSVSNSSSITFVQDEENPYQETQEEILIVGRHPDCNIMLTHPSISRFHLQINSNPSSQKLFITDLSSVHGTWVSGKKIEPGSPVELIEGDTIRVGGSTRVYTLHWVPLSCAYDMENPFLSALDMTMNQEKQEEEEHALLEEENAVEAHQDETALLTECKHIVEKVSLVVEGKEQETCHGENTLSIESEGIVEEDSCVKEGKDACQDENALSIECKHIEEKVSVVVEGKEEEKCQDMNSLPIESEHIVEEDSSMKEGENVENFQDESSLSIESKHMGGKDTLAVQKTEETFQDENSLSVEDKEIQSMDLNLEGIDSLFSDDYSGLIMKKEIPSVAPSMPENMETIICDETEEDEQSKNDHEVRETQSVKDAISDVKKLQVSNENETPQPLFALQPLSERGDQEDATAYQTLNLLVNLNSSCSDEEGNYTAVELLEEAENQNLPRNDHLLSEISSLSSVPLPTESVNSSKAVGKVLAEITDYKESQIPQSLFAAAAAGLSKTFQDDNSLSVESKDIQSMDLNLKGIDSLFSDDYSGLIMKKEIPSAPSMSENMETIICDEMEENEQSRNDHEVRETQSVKDTLSDIKKLQVSNENNTPQPLFALQPLSERGDQEDATAYRTLNLLVNLNSSCSDEGGNYMAAELLEEAENQNLPRKDHLLREISSLSSPLPTESVNSSKSVGKVLAEITDYKESQTPQSLFAAAAAGPSKTFKDDNSLSVENKEIQTKDLNLEGIDSLFSDDYSGLIMKKEIPSAPPMPENMETIILYETEENEQSRNDHEVRETQSVKEALSEVKKLQVSNENETPQPLFALQPLAERGDQEDATADRNLNLLVNLNSSCSDEEGNYPAAELLEEAENSNLPRKDHILREISSLSSVPLPTESVNSSKPVGKVLAEITDYKEGQTLQSLFAAAPGLSKIEKLESSSVKSEKRSTMDIWSRRGKPATVIQIQTGRSRGKTTRANSDAGVEHQNQKNIENRSISKALFSGLEGMEEEIYTPDKENFTPNTLLLKSLKKKGKLGEIRHSKSSRSSSSKVTFSHNIQPEEGMIASSDKENQTPKVLQQWKSAKPTSENQVKLEQEMMVMKRRAAERVPFQSLIVYTEGKSRSEASGPNVAARSSNSVCCTQTMEKRITHSSSNNSVGEGKRSWTMVVDTASLLDKESRKSLQLLQGLKGTQLIIPRMVIRELDCLKRRGSLFRRTTEVSSVLDWIEECMIKTNWWIHVQSSVEEGRPIAPTPPASPRSRFSEGSGGFPCGSTTSVTFSTRGSLMEIATPTAEDHILDCALLFRKMKNEGQLVLLSNDVTLKIKAMAEGLICETAQEFRESLVNPFSERFLWADSSPRGRTWSYLDDVVLREKYNRCPLKKSFKGEGAKGLKLILLHNSQYGQITSVS